MATAWLISAPHFLTFFLCSKFDRPLSLYPKAKVNFPSNKLPTKLPQLKQITTPNQLI